MNKKGWKLMKKSILTSFQVRTALESWTTDFTNPDKLTNDLLIFNSLTINISLVCRFCNLLKIYHSKILDPLAVLHLDN